jgi:formyl-CoA transferase
MNAGSFFATGKAPKRRGNAHPTITPYETFEVADGWINVGAANEKFWRLLCDALDVAELCDDPRFRVNADRVSNRPALRALLDPIFLRHPRRHWLEVLTAAGVPCGEIKTVAEVCTAPQLVERGMIQSMPHAAAGAVRAVASAIRFDDAPPPPPAPPPLLAEHTDDVLSEWLGLGGAETQALATAGAFGNGKMVRR